MHSKDSIDETAERKLKYDDEMFRGKLTESLESRAVKSLLTSRAFQSVVRCQ